MIADFANVRCGARAIPLSLLIDIWLGLLFAYCARARVRTDGVWSQPAISIVSLFVVVILLPTTLYIYLGHPGWTWLYLVNPNRITGVAVVSIAAACVGGAIGGYYGGGRLVRADKEKVLLIASGALALVIVALALLLRTRLLAYGSYEDFHAGRALPLGAVKLGYVLVPVLIGVCAAAIFVALELRRDGRRAG